MMRPQTAEFVADASRRIVADGLSQNATLQNLQIVETYRSIIS
jgi:hypothetical protein